MESYGPVYEIQSSDQELAQRFRADPFAPPGPEMMRLLNRLRWQPLAGKHVIVCTERHRMNGCWGGWGRVAATR